MRSRTTQSHMTLSQKEIHQTKHTRFRFVQGTLLAVTFCSTYSLFEKALLRSNIFNKILIIRLFECNVESYKYDRIFEIFRIFIRTT